MNQPDEYKQELDKAHANKREAFASRKASPLRPFDDAQARRPKIDMSLKTEAPLKLGISELNPSLEELQDYIDWMPYFNAWEFSGRFPDLLSDPSKGPEARKLWKDTQVVLERLIKEKF